MALKILKRRPSALVKGRRKIIVQDVAAIDQFKELPARKKQAVTRAVALGHQLRGFVKRSNDPWGRWNAFCHDCNKLVVVCTETPDGFDDIYGSAVTQECQPTQSDFDGVAAGEGLAGEEGILPAD